ncbi:MAG: hypothetical protein KDA91_11175 [Planctomycetaceae bacterium]|nr:hypothetical protein [Planctomycetaceae bacterium]
MKTARPAEIGANGRLSMAANDESTTQSAEFCRTCTHESTGTSTDLEEGFQSR